MLFADPLSRVCGPTEGWHDPSIPSKVATLLKYISSRAKKGDLKNKIICRQRHLRSFKNHISVEKAKEFLGIIHNARWIKHFRRYFSSIPRRCWRCEQICKFGSQFNQAKEAIRRADSHIGHWRDCQAGKRWRRKILWHGDHICCWRSFQDSFGPGRRDVVDINSSTNSALYRNRLKRTYRKWQTLKQQLLKRKTLRSTNP